MLQPTIKGLFLTRLSRVFRALLFHTADGSEIIVGVIIQHTFQFEKKIKELMYFNIWMINRKTVKLGE